MNFAQSIINDPNLRTRGKLTAIAVHPERGKHNRQQLITRCECGQERIVEASSFKRGECRACKICVKEVHRQSLSIALAKKYAERGPTAMIGVNPRPEQVDALIQQRIKAMRKLGIEFEVADLRAEIERECATADFSDLLIEPVFHVEVRRSSSLARAMGGGM